MTGKIPGPLDIEHDARFDDEPVPFWPIERADIGTRWAVATGIFWAVIVCALILGWLYLCLAKPA